MHTLKLGFRRFVLCIIAALAFGTSASAHAQSGSACDPAQASGAVGRLVRAMLDTIATTEGTRAHGKDGYNVMFTYKYFDSCSHHPNRNNCSGSLCSTAAGRYQFLKRTWDSLSYSTFYPSNQDKGASDLIRGRNVTLPSSALTQTGFRNAMDRLSYEWASLPPGRYGQPSLSYDKAYDVYCKFAQCGAVSVDCSKRSGFLVFEDAETKRCGGVEGDNTTWVAFNWNDRADDFRNDGTQKNTCVFEHADFKGKNKHLPRGATLTWKNIVSSNRWTSASGC